MRYWIGPQIVRLGDKKITWIHNFRVSIAILSAGLDELTRDISDENTHTINVNVPEPGQRQQIHHHMFTRHPKIQHIK